MTSFACDKVPGTSQDIIIPNFASREEFDRYLNDKVSKSLVTPNPPEPTVANINQVVALYTCNEPDNKYRIIVYCAVSEFLPAGSNVAKSSSLVDASDVQTVQNAAGERLK